MPGRRWWDVSLPSLLSSQHSLTHRQKTGLCGPCTLMEMPHQPQGNLKHVFYTYKQRRQIYCMQLNKEAGLANLRTRFLEGNLGGWRHPGGGSCGWYFAHTLSTSTYQPGEGFAFPWDCSVVLMSRTHIHSGLHPLPTLTTGPKSRDQ